MSSFLLLILLAAVLSALYVIATEAPVRRWLMGHREWLWLGLVIGGAWLAWDRLPAIDPYTDLKNLPGDLGNTLALVARGIIAVILSYLCKSFFTTDLSDNQEAQLRLDLQAGPLPPAPTLTGNPDSDDRALTKYREDVFLHIERARSARDGARLILIADRLGWLPWLGFWFFALFRS